MYMMEKEIPQALIEALKKRFNTDEILYLSEAHDEEKIIAFIVEKENEEDNIQIDIYGVEENSINVDVWEGDLFSCNEDIKF